MSGIQQDQDIDELVDFKVRKRVAIKVIKDIHHQLDDIEQQIKLEKTASKILLPLLFIFLVIIISILIFVPDILRQVSGLIG